MWDVTSTKQNVSRKIRDTQMCRYWRQRINERSSGLRSSAFLSRVVQAHQMSYPWKIFRHPGLEDPEVWDPSLKDISTTSEMELFTQLFGSG